MFLRLRDLLGRLVGPAVALNGGLSTPGVVRVGDTVRRPVMKESAFVHELLGHLERRGFDRAPRFLGVDDKGRAMLTYIAGVVPHQLGGFQKEQWLAAARLLRLFHDATVDCELKGECEVVCHGDPGPGNYVLTDGMPFALIDFDAAHPGKREDDVGYAAWMWLHIGEPTVAPEEQGTKLMDFVAAYDATAPWNPLDVVLHAQYALLARIPNSRTWASIRTWAQACLAWTERHREGIAAGVAVRSDDPPARRSAQSFDIAPFAGGGVSPSTIPPFTSPPVAGPDASAP